MIRPAETIHGTPVGQLSVIEAYRRALFSQMQPAMLLLAIGPAVVAALFWLGVMWWKWSTLVAALDALLKALPLLETMSERLMLFGVKIIPSLVMTFAFIALFVPLTMLTALSFISVVGMPIMTRHVAARNYPNLERRRGGSVAGSLANSLVALGWFLVWAVPTFVLWFVPVIGFLIPLFLLGRLNARVLRYDALAEHADAGELRRLMGTPALRWDWLGILGAAMNLIPFLWFFSTTLTGLAFIHAALAALNSERAPALAIPVGQTIAP